MDWARPPNMLKSMWNVKIKYGGWWPCVPQDHSIFLQIIYKIIYNTLGDTPFYISETEQVWENYALCSDTGVTVWSALTRKLSHFSCCCAIGSYILSTSEL